MRKNVISSILYSIFFITGAAGLIYQVLWTRMFGLVFGNTVFASSTVLAAFMAGLAIGSYFFGAYISKKEKTNELKIYALMELIVGVFGMSMPFIKEMMEVLYTWFYRTFNPSFVSLTLFRFFISFIVLVIPCIFMGATLPVISKYISEKRQGKSIIIGRLYGINTIGAVIGSLLSGFYFVGRLGLSKTSIIAAVFNFTAAFVSFVLYAKSKGNRPEIEMKNFQKKKKEISEKKEEKINTGLVPENKRLGKLLLITYALSGFAALALEVAWVRAMVWIMSMDSYAFAAILSVILAGIGLGSLIYTLVARKIMNDKGFLIIVQFLIGIFVLVSIYMIQHSIGIRNELQNVLNNIGSFKFIYKAINPVTLAQLILSAFVLLIPSILMGIAFPVFTGIYIRICGKVGKGIGNIYSANTFGAIFGSLAMGFIIMPVFGLLPSIAIMSCIYFLTAILLFLGFFSGQLKQKMLRIAAIAAIVVFLIVATDLSSVNFIKTTLNKGNIDETEKLLYFKENATGDVLVKQSKDYGNEMLIDGVQVASDGDFDLPSHIYPAHLMSLLKRDPEDVLVVAFGTGGTSGSILKYNEVKRLDAVEICDGVIAPAKQFFLSMNSNVFANPKLNIIIQDGKNYVKMTDKYYDIIYSGPIHPQSNQGSAALYTKDYFKDCKLRLKSDGFQVLWLPMHMSTADDFKIIVKTFMEVYPYVSMWDLPATDTSVAHPHLIGSMKPIYPDYQVISEKLKRPEIINDLKRLNETSFSKPYEFISQFIMGEEGLKKLVGSISILNTDDLPVVEFYKRPNDYLVSTAASKVLLLAETAKYMENPYKYVQNIPEDEKVELKKQLDRLYEGNKNIIMGHCYFTAKKIVKTNVDQLIYDNYSRAYKLIPESTYLKNFFKK